MAQEVYKQYSEFISSQKTNPDIGITFNNGWSPELELVEVNGGVYLKFKQWIGGEGDIPSAPPTGWEYITPTGFGEITTAINLRVTAGAGGLYIDEVVATHIGMTPATNPYVVFDEGDSHVWIWDGTIWHDADSIDTSGKADKTGTGAATIFVNNGAGNLVDSGTTISQVIANAAASIGVFTDTIDGLVPAPTALTGEYYLRHDGTWQIVSGGGGGATTLDGLTDVILSSPSVNELLRYDGAGIWRNQDVKTTYLNGKTDRYYKNQSYSTTTLLTIPSTYPYDVIDVLIGNPTPQTLTIKLSNPTTVNSATIWIKGTCTYGGCTIVIQNNAGTTLATYTGTTGLHLFGYNGTSWYLVAEVIMPDKLATSTTTGLIQLSTNSEVAIGSNPTKAVTPAGLASLIGTSSTRGIVQLATNNETLIGTNITKVVTPDDLAARVPLIQEVIDIGTWNMGSVSTKSVVHGLGANYKKIRSINIIVRNDNDDTYEPLDTENNGGALITNGITSISAVNIDLIASSYWNDGAHDLTVLNRGWITIWRTY